MKVHERAPTWRAIAWYGESGEPAPFVVTLPKRFATR